MSGNEQRFECDRGVDAAAYVLGALTDGEAYREHLAGCASCQAEVAKLQPVADTLAATAPAVPAPPALRERILAAVRAEAELLQAAGHEADQPARPAGRRRAWRSTAVRASVALAVGAAAATVVALSVGGSSTRERVSTGRVAVSAPGARATVRQLGTRAELLVSGMPQPPPGRIYEVWLRRATGPPQPTDALFGVTSRGSGAASVPDVGRGVREVLVTSEPLGGSAHPTSAPLIRVALRS
jgi:hypothetical protein